MSTGGQALLAAIIALPILGTAVTMGIITDAVRASVAGTTVVAMAHKYSGMTVAAIIAQYKRGSVMKAALPPGGPGWKEILEMVWEDIVEAAKCRQEWAIKVRKLLLDSRFNK
jgi:hypothetical protein